MNSDWMRVGYSAWYSDFGILHVWIDGLASQADSLAMAVFDMLMCGIAHWDIRGQNVIIQHNPSTQDCKVVLLDFAFCRTIGPPEVEMLNFQLEIVG